MDRAHSLFQIKSVDASRRIIEGIASTPTPDRGGDVMEPAGAEFSLPLPFLWKHTDPIGEVFAADVRPDGIYIKARVSTVDAKAPAHLRARIDEAWHSMTASPPLVRGLSIGWSPIESAPIKGTRFTRVLKWVWGELSAVVVPMNAEATILSIKSLDTSALASSGIRRTVSPITPAAAGNRKDSPMTTSEQLTAEKTNLQAKMARLEELMQQDEAGTLDDADAPERDTLAKEVPDLTVKVQRLTSLESAQAALAGGIVAAPAAQRRASQTTETKVEVVPRMKGQAFVRYAMAVAAGKGSHSDTLAYAKRFTDTPEVVQYIKAEAGTSVVTSPAWGGELVYPTNLVSEFVELLRPATIVGRIGGFRMTPFNIRVPRQQLGSTVNWVGEAAPKPVSELSFDTITMAYHKVAGIVVLTDELVRLSSPSAEETVRRDLVEQIARFIDAQFVTPGVSAGANNPASITNGVASPAATGADLDSFRLDLFTALATFDATDLGAEGLVIITTSAIARGISMYLNPLGQTPTGFNVTPTGGTLLGYPVIVSNSVPSGTLIIIKPSEILMADDGRVTLDASNQATLDMLGGSPGAPTFNLWQRNCTAIRAERWLTWLPRRDGAVAVIDTASYGPSVGSP